MTSPPVSNRQYAYFVARAPAGEPDQVTELLGLQPDTSWRRDDQFEMAGRTLRRRSSSWRLDSHLDDTQETRRHVAALLERLAPYGIGLEAVRREFQTRIVCVAYSYQAFGWYLDVETQERAVALGIGFEFDIYNLGDHHEEIVSLREQLGLRPEGR